MLPLARASIAVIYGLLLPIQATSRPVIPAAVVKYLAITSTALQPLTKLRVPSLPTELETGIQVFMHARASTITV